MAQARTWAALLEFLAWKEPAPATGNSPATNSARSGPNYLSFAGTYQCNLTCPHCCVPIEWPDRLDIADALRFLEDAHAAGIDVLGFTGGEPFLYPEFLVALTRRAAELGFRFDKVMTNGVWFSDDADTCAACLTELRDAGFTRQARPERGQVPRHPHRRSWPSSAASPARVFDRDTILSLSATPAARRTRAWSRSGGWRRSWTAWSSGRSCCGRYLLVSDDLTMTLNWNHLAPVERAERLAGRPWDGEWFEEDYCEGPGQALIVNPKGRGEAVLRLRVRPRPAHHRQHPHRHASRRSSARLAKHPYVGKVFREGLTAIRDEILARDPDALPGATSNHCYFCWYVLTRGLAAGVNGGGGKVGAWVGDRPNFTGELIELGLRR